ncbi:MAG: cation:dicarboxylase symporter family transporter [Mycoplasmataceae bacterium]|nr:cation:dicarboxylase symporter family transporter [Mycoplasmataceae bacterium]
MNNSVFNENYYSIITTEDITVGGTFYPAGSEIFQISQSVVINNLDEFQSVIPEQGQLEAELVTNWQIDAIIWLNLIPNIFISLMILFVPLLIFVNIFLSIVKNSGQGKTFFRTFLTFSFTISIGILVAIALTPIWSRVGDGGLDYDNIYETNEALSIPGIITGWMPSSISIFASTAYVMGCVTLGIFIGIIVHSIDKTDHERAEGIISGFENFKVLINTSIKYIAMLIPLVIMSKIPTLFLDNIGQNFSSIGIYLGGFFLGTAIIFIILAILKLLFKPKDVHIKKMYSDIKEPITYGFFTQSSAATIPYSIEAMKRVGIKEDIASVVPSFGSSAGLINCAAFYPASIAIVTLFNTDGFGVANSLFSFFIILFIITLVSSFGLAGVPGIAGAATATVVSGVGLSLTFYTLLLAIDPLIDMFRTANNVDAILTDTIIVNKWDEITNKNKLSKREIRKINKIERRFK